MLKKSAAQVRVRLVGLWASILAVIAVSVTVLADNHSGGFGRILPREEQMVLLLIALLLFAAQAIACQPREARVKTRSGPNSIRCTEREKQILRNL